MPDGSPWWPSGPQAAQQIEIGHRYMLAQRFERAIECFGAAIGFEPENADAHGRLAIALLAVGRYEDADRVAAAAQQQWPEVAPLLQVRSSTLCALGKWHEATALLQHAVALLPECHMLYVSLGSILFQQEQYAEAETPLRHALQMEPEDWRTLLVFAATLSAQNKWQEADKTFETVLQQAPHESAVHAEAALYFLQTDKPEPASIHANEALRIEPENELAQHCLALLNTAQIDAQPDAEEKVSSE
jgi:tetratricopeptide (TPR) repeat protein